jgi:integrase
MQGSIQKRVGKRGVTWTVVVDMPPDPATGKRRQKRLTAPTKREVEELAAKHIQSMSEGSYAESSRLTLAEYLDRWLASLGQSVRPSTRRRYTDLMRQHVIPIIGHVRLSQLAPLHIQQLHADRLAAGLSPTTVAFLHFTLHRALKQAQRWNVVARNVTELVDAPRKARPEHQTWTAAQVAAFLAVADADEQAAFWRLSLLTGMRRGELLGLKWDDLDLAKGALAVRRSLSRGEKGSFEPGAPKTASGRRAVALPSSATEALRAHRARQLAHRLEVGGAYQDQGYVFTSAEGHPLHPNSVAYKFARLTARAKLPRVRLHDLRHTSATLSLTNGEHPKIVQERLGHSGIAITLDRYSHVTMDMQRAAAERLDALLKAAAESA